jgi:hypothetical protein
MTACRLWRQIQDSGRRMCDGGYIRLAALYSGPLQSCDAAASEQLFWDLVDAAAFPQSEDADIRLTCQGR